MYVTCCTSACLSVCSRLKTRSQWIGDFWSKRVILTLTYLSRFSGFTIQFFSSDFWVFAIQPTVHRGGVSKWRVCGCGCLRLWQVTRDMWQYDMWHVICYMWHVTCDTWHVKHNTWNMTWRRKKFSFSPCLSVLVLVLLSANVERFSVSHMWVFFTRLIPPSHFTWNVPNPSTIG